jgi:hypothetical protein
VKYLLSGILRCSVCEKGVTTGMSGKHKTYRCPDGHLARNMAKTDSVVVEALVKRLASDEARELFRYEGEAKQLIESVKLAQDLRARLDGFTDQAADGKLTPERLARIEAKLLPKIKQAEERAARSGSRRLWRNWSARRPLRSGRRSRSRRSGKSCARWCIPDCCPLWAGGHRSTPTRSAGPGWAARHRSPVWTTPARTRSHSGLNDESGPGTRERVPGPLSCECALKPSVGDG